MKGTSAGSDIYSSDGSLAPVKRTDSMHRRGLSLPARKKKASLPGGKIFDLAKLQTLPFDFEGNYKDRKRKAFVQQRIRAMREATASFKGSFEFLSQGTSPLSSESSDESTSSNALNTDRETTRRLGSDLYTSQAKVERVTLDLLMRQHKEQTRKRLTETGLLGRKTKSFAIKKTPALVFEDGISFSTNVEGISPLLRRSSSLRGLERL